MTDFVVLPNLPINASHVIIGEDYAGILSPKLKELGINVISIPPNRSVAKNISCHADISLMHFGGNRIIASQGTDRGFLTHLAEFGFEISVCRELQGSCYPEDTQVNAVYLNGNLICNPQTVSCSVMEHFKYAPLIKVRQGYTKCNTCIVDSKSVITSDPGIAAILTNKGFDVLKIKPGSIELPGYDYGFIGGCAFKLSADRLAFTGRLDAHPDKQAIEAFAKKRGVDIVFLTDRPAFDIGSALPVIEN